jgi:superfamily II DNA or RNA helicase
VIFHQPNTPKELEDHINYLAEQEFHKRMKRFGHMKGVNAQEQKSRCVWQFAQEHGVFLNKQRNASLIQLANHHAQENDSAILLIGKIEHGEALATQIPGAQMVYSKMGAKKRREAIAEFAAGNTRTIIATSLADEGLDVPRANVLICGSAGRSQAKAEQRTGRVLRQFEGKEHGIIHDFMDVQHYFLKAQSNRRAQTYKALGYHIQFPE